MRSLPPGGAGRRPSGVVVAPRTMLPNRSAVFPPTGYPVGYELVRWSADLRQRLVRVSGAWWVCP